MQILRFLNVKEGSLVFTNHLGEEFKVELDEEHIRSLRSALRPSRESDTNVKPREIQALLRSGLDSQQVADKLGLELEDIARYEGPILAELKYVLESSHRVEVRTSEHEIDSSEPQMFGEVINSRVETMTNKVPEWTVWKNEDNEWMLRASFTADGEDREADWFFDHRKQTLTPVTTEAINLSKQDASEKLIPTLRAVEHIDEDTESYDEDDSVETASTEDTPHLFSSAVSDHQEDDPLTLPPVPGASGNTPLTNFDDSVFTESTNALIETPPVIDEYSRRRLVEDRAITRAGDEDETETDTADLLIALRKKRSKREIVEKQVENDSTEQDNIYDLQSEPLPSLLETEALETVDIPTFPERQFSETDEIENSPSRKNKKGRASIPSWDEILFGQKNDADE